MNSTLINDFGKKIGGARKDTWKGRGLSLSDLYEMTAEEKKLIQAQHRLEEAQMRAKEKARKARTRRLIQEGAVLEKVLPEVRTMELPALEGYLSRKLGKEI